MRVSLLLQIQKSLDNRGLKTKRSEYHPVGLDSFVDNLVTC